MLTTTDSLDRDRLVARIVAWRETRLGGRLPWQQVLHLRTEPLSVLKQVWDHIQYGQEGLTEENP